MFPYPQCFMGTEFLFGMIKKKVLPMYTGYGCTALHI